MHPMSIGGVCELYQIRCGDHRGAVSHPMCVEESCEAKMLEMCVKESCEEKMLEIDE